MLCSIKSGATKTRIMYSAYMSYSQLHTYLSLLQERNLISYDATTSLYTLTEKGLRFMNAYDQIQELVPNAVERNRSSKESLAPEAVNQ
jgi:predicted transcriptional regulator